MSPPTFNNDAIERWYLWKTQIFRDLDVSYELFFIMNGISNCTITYNKFNAPYNKYYIHINNKVPYHRSNTIDLACCLFMNIPWDIALDPDFARELHYVNQSTAARKPL